VACVPAQHFSGRGLADRDRTLWCGWVIRPRGAAADGGAADAPPSRAVLFAGDTALHPEFAAIARRYAPIALALLPVGAYAPRWFMRPVHCDPDDAVAAYAALAEGARDAAPVMGGMHWGTFRLTDEPLDEPPRRTRDAWARAGRDAALLWLPALGETRRV
jgi:N-acyl-phosphatidylethanolamine-hydrolysing phospholipase D